MNLLSDYCLEMLRQVNNSIVNNCVGHTHTISESDLVKAYSGEVFDYYDNECCGDIADLEKYEQWLIMKK